MGRAEYSQGRHREGKVAGLEDKSRDKKQPGVWQSPQYATSVNLARLETSISSPDLAQIVWL